MIVLDTNIWLYSHDSRDPDKKQRSQELIQTASPLALLWQVGCEFIAASRKLQPLGFTQEEAWAALDDMCAMADLIILPEPEVWAGAREVQRRHGFSFWDGLIVAACVRAGVLTLYSEDLPTGLAVDGLMIVNPFVG